MAMDICRTAVRMTNRRPMGRLVHALFPCLVQPTGNGRMSMPDGESRFTLGGGAVHLPPQF